LVERVAFDPFFSSGAGGLVSGLLVAGGGFSPSVMAVVISPFTVCAYVSYVKINSLIVSRCSAYALVIADTLST
jgi:hypothetical protein